ncbi:MAG: hypothetical protein IJH91_00395 [Mogibacterium sp.]|nr:hypothetical protein [Mogibacterium sp.]
MERFEMIEKLRDHADVSYEEAKKVLEQANGDLLDAIVILEQQGKVREPQSKVREEKTRRAKGAVGDAFRTLKNFLCHTAFHVTRNGKEVFVMPTLVFALIMLFAFYTILPIMLIALFFNVRYNFTGSADAKKVNDILCQAGDFAEGVKTAATKDDAEGTSAE